MNKKIAWSVFTAALLLGGCRPGPGRTDGASGGSDGDGPPTGAPLSSVEPYQDVRFSNLSMLSVDPAPERSLVQTLWFNDTAPWPDAYRTVAAEILELGKNPGLGVRGLHEQGITGEGVFVAIIDQNLVAALDHPEFTGKIAKYRDTGTGQPDNRGSMHGPAVASLLVGETLGTAPGALLYFAAVPSWNKDALYFADGLDWIVEENGKLPEGKKIRVVSVSAKPSGPDTPFTANTEAWDAAVERAESAGILVVDCSEHRGVTAPLYCDLDDPDDITRCIRGWPEQEELPAVRTDRLYIPTSRRTTAEEYFQGKTGYQFTGSGGLSWSAPYLAGVLALGWQIRPDLTGADMLRIAFDTAHQTAGGAKILDPVAFIEGVRSAARG
jgi:serine protease AprX